MTKLQTRAALCFVVLCILTWLSLSPAVVLLASFFFPPAFILGIIAPTVLLYSFATAPLVLLIRRRKSLEIFFGLVILLSVALGPGLVAQWDARSFAARVSKTDIEKATTQRPKFVEIADDDLPIVVRSVGAPRIVPCNEPCQRLLFNREVGRVRMVRHFLPSRNTPVERSIAMTYRLERRDLCPDASLPERPDEKAVRDRIVAGECLIASLDDDSPADVVLTTITLNRRDQFNLQEADRPFLAGWVSSRRMTVTERGSAEPALVRTESNFIILPIPFRFDYSFNMGTGNVGPELGHTPLKVNPIDVAETLRRMFGFSVAPVAPAGPNDPIALTDQLLSTPASIGDTFSREQHNVIADALTALAAKPSLSDSDIRTLVEALTGRVLKLFDARGKAQVIKKLQELGLISAEGSILVWDRGEYSGGLDLSGADFAGVELDGACLYRMNLTNANFANASLKNTDFGWSFLRGINFEGACLEGARFSAYDLMDAGIDPLAFMRMYNAHVSRPD